MKGWTGLSRMVLIAVASVLLVVFGLGFGAGAAVGATRPAVSCVRGDIEITGWMMASSRHLVHHQHRTISGVTLFEVKCTPIAAQLEMRLQKWVKVHGRYERRSQTPPDIYTASGDPPATIFAMTREWVCSPGKWQIFIHVLAGVNHDHKAVPPENFFFPVGEKGFYFNCKRFQHTGTD